MSFIFAIIISVVLLVFSAIIHECAHGWVAGKCGDPTARMMGRITLNPIKHIDPFLTIIMPTMLAIMHLPVFGGAKPVPVNFNNLRNPKRDMIWVAAAGPASNILLVIAASLIMVIFYRLAALGIISINIIMFIQEILTLFIEINLALAIFNLIPIPPLDGSRIAYGLLPYPLANSYAKLETFGILIIFVLLYLGALNWLGPIIDLLSRHIEQAVGMTFIN